MKDYKKMGNKAAGGMKLMKNHGNTKPINADGQKQDMGRMQVRPMEHRGYDNKAFEYKY